ncbi:SRPBCC family protein [Paraconexibacter sp.]|uniref:SRPBCC family protein n=1 Tax=Paraconexibacter sp. TaxID=2949640 RepID=UPI003569D2D6
MPTIRRSRTIAASPEDLWRIVGDPYHLPRWWPRVLRVEAVNDSAFTQVMTTERGRNVRADFRLTALDEPTKAAWEQQVAGTPFEHLLDHSSTAVTLSPQAQGTKVTIEQRTKMRGISRLGGPMVRKAGRGLLDEALDGLERLHGEG